MFPFKRKSPPPSGLSRARTLAMVPVVSRDVAATTGPDGLVRLSLPVVVRPALAGLARRLGLWDGRSLRRTLELDAMGSAVWGLFDGRRAVGEIAVALAERYRLDTREAELAVAAFLRQLGRRGAIGLAERGEPPRACER